MPRAGCSSFLRFRNLVLGLTAVLAMAPLARAGDVSVKLDIGTGFAVKNNSGAIERLRVDESTGNISRNGALFVHTTGTNNLFVGPGAGNPSTTGFGGNLAFGRNALASITTGVDNSAVGDLALRRDTTGSFNTAFGRAALYGNTSGSWHTAVGHAALNANTTGTGNSAVGYRALALNGTGSANSALGTHALTNNTMGGANSAFGYRALFHNRTGHYNSAFGVHSVYLNYSGSGNAGFGYRALRSNEGSFNAAVGFRALTYNSTGFGNAALGQKALENNATGSRNVAVGAGAGSNQTTGSDNIYLANAGVAGESGQIRIGTVGTHTQATVAGVHGSTSSDGVAVLVNASGTLGTTSSSIRFKQDVRDMADASALLMKLRPVVFRYREEAVGAEEAQATQYGLIAEEVHQVAPELVASDLDGKPYSVKYHVLPALLVNEVQRQERVIAALSARLEAIERGAECRDAVR